MALYQNCITIRRVKTLRMRETAAKTTIAREEQNRTGAEKTVMNPANSRKTNLWGLPGNTKRHHWSFGDFGHKLPYIFQPSQNKAHHTFLQPAATPISPPRFQPSVTGHRGVALSQDTNSPKLKRRNSASHCDHNALECSPVHTERTMS